VPAPPPARGRPLLWHWLLLLLLLSPAPAWGREGGVAPTLPLWEYGVAGLAAHLPHYRGSSEYSSYLLPLPYFIYRGESFQADRDGLRGIFWRHGPFESDLSLAGNPPVPGDNPVRDGMPERDALVELGPALRGYLYSHGERDALFFQANLRAAFSLGFASGMAYQGVISDLALVYRDARTLRAQRIFFHLSAGVQGGDSRLHEYFYEVAPAYATPARPEYQAGAGYGGLQISGSVVKELTRGLQLGGYLRWVHSGGAAFADSPLVQTDNNLVLGAMLLVRLGESAQPAR
jgi:MipA family protein